MNRVRQPFNVNSLALAAAAAALDDMEFVARSYAENLQGLRQLEEGARGLGLDYIPSHGNFLTVRVGKAPEIYKRLLRRGVIVRPVGGGYGLPEHLRVTVGTAAGERAVPRRARREPEGRRCCSSDVAVIGVGLIGGSFALALKQARRGARTSSASAATARTSSSRAERGIIDAIAAGRGRRGARRRPRAGRRAGRRSSASIFADAAAVEPQGASITDAGSTKRDVVAAARAALGAEHRRSSCPAHPIAGAEKSGAAAASADAVSRTDAWC